MRPRPSLASTLKACLFQLHYSYSVSLSQESDLRYLIENIWAGQSALSAEKDLFELTMVRWDVHQPWLPWNCILLTKEEARAHVELEDPEMVW